jgi:sugar lactone lactonase YvrE
MRQEKKMNKLFVALIFVCFGTILLSVSAKAGGLAFDAAGNLLWADSNKYSIVKLTPDGTKSSFATGLKYPLSLCFDANGNLFVSDGAANTAKNQRSILKFGPDGTKGTFATGISSAGMAFDRSGNLFVSQDDCIFKFTPAGAKSTFVSGLGNAIDLAFDGAGNLFVVDQAVKGAVGRSIVKITSDGTKSTFVPDLKDPSALAVDADGNVYVDVSMADNASSYGILKLTPDGTKRVLTSALRPYGASALAVDHSGNVFASTDHEILKLDSSGIPSAFASDWVSPDRQWEFKLVDDKWPAIVKAGTAQVVLDLVKELEVLSGSGASEAVWAPDSTRFALHYSAPHARHTTRKTVAFYQLRGEKWIQLRLPVDESSSRSQLVQLANKHLPKSAYPRHAQPFRDILQMREWTDANTAILYADSVWEEGGSHESEAAFLFTLKFDEAGNWKIIKTHQMSKKELEEEQ